MLNEKDFINYFIDKDDVNNIVILSYLNNKYNINIKNVDEKRIGILNYKYKISVGNNEYKLKYKPYRVYKTYILVRDENSFIYYLYNVNNNSYEKLDFAVNVKFYNNFIILKEQVLYIVNNTILDITSIYDILKKCKRVNCNYNKLISSSYFQELCKNNPEYQLMLEEMERERVKKQALKAEKVKRVATEQEQKELNNSKEEIERLTTELESAINKYSNRLEEFDLEKIPAIIKRIKMINKNNKKRIRIHNHILLTQVDDHYEIREEFLSVLSYLDLSLIDFTNVDIRGVNFDNTNVNLDFQKVYLKDISGCSFKNVNFNFIFLDDIKIDNTDFSQSIFHANEPKTIKRRTKTQK